MKKVIMIVVLLVMVPFVAIAASVGGYMRDSDHDGVKETYVAPHERTNPNSSRTDNYGYPGNYNPNSGSVTPQSSSPRENYPANPSPYEKPKSRYGY